VNNDASTTESGREIATMHTQARPSGCSPVGSTGYNLSGGGPGQVKTCPTPSTDTATGETPSTLTNIRHDRVAASVSCFGDRLGSVQALPPASLPVCR
jgi:hypothetical protein